VSNTFLKEFLKKAIEEDIGSGDITTEFCIPISQYSVAYIIAKEEGIIAGMPFVIELYALIDKSLKIEIFKQEGIILKKGDIIATIKGRTKSILMGERIGLNLIQRLSGIATLTKKFVDAVKDTKVKILDTRKTTPNMRMFEKYAVRIGGGFNHRFGLYDGILIKDNHIKAVGSIKEAVERVKKAGTRMLKIEVEVENLQQLKEALYVGVDMIMLDNMPLSMLKEAVKITKQYDPSVKLEASGGINLQNIKDIAETGVDFISIGSITHSAKAIDISMEIE